MPGRSNDFDLIAMGRPEGPGCYCYANNVLKSVLTEISSHYPYVVLDKKPVWKTYHGALFSM